jgi:hypothetical protein
MEMHMSINKLLYRRKRTAQVLDTSIYSVKRLEKKGLLAIVKLSGSPGGMVHHWADQVEALARSKSNAAR